MKTNLYNCFILGLAIALLSSCGGGKSLVTYTIDQGKVKKVLSFQGDSAKHKLAKEETFTVNDVKLSEINFKKGVLDGAWISYWENGKIREEGNYSKGLKNGMFKQYDSKGRLLLEGELRNGLKEGVWITWYDDTQKEEERSYTADVLNGKYTYWYIDGSLKKEEYYENGKKIKETVYQ